MCCFFLLLLLLRYHPSAINNVTGKAVLRGGVGARNATVLAVARWWGCTEDSARRTSFVFSLLSLAHKSSRLRECGCLANAAVATLGRAVLPFSFFPLFSSNDHGAQLFFVYAVRCEQLLIC